MTVDKSWPDRAIAVLTLKLSAASARSQVNAAPQGRHPADT